MRLYHLTPVSSNAKTGPIAVTTSSRNLCPDTCPLKAGGCYAKGGPLSLHWDKVTNGLRGVPIKEHCEELKALPPDRMVRLNQAGDLPSGPSLYRIIDALLDRKVAFTYTHHTTKAILRVVAASNKHAKTHGTGLVVNLSANNPKDADKKLALKIGPVTTLIPAETPDVSFTPGGTKIVACPAITGKTSSCSTCGNGKPLCARPDRSYIIGFKPHGSGSRKANDIASQ